MERTGSPLAIASRRSACCTFDLEKDIGEKTDVKDQHPAVVNRIKTLADAIRADRRLRAMGKGPARSGPAVVSYFLYAHDGIG